MIYRKYSEIDKEINDYFDEKIRDGGGSFYEYLNMKINYYIRTKDMIRYHYSFNPLTTIKFNKEVKKLLHEYNFVDSIKQRTRDSKLKDLIK